MCARGSRQVLPDGIYDNKVDDQGGKDKGYMAVKASWLDEQWSLLEHQVSHRTIPRSDGAAVVPGAHESPAESGGARGPAGRLLRRARLKPAWFFVLPSALI